VDCHPDRACKRPGFLCGLADHHVKLIRNAKRLYPRKICDILTTPFKKAIIVWAGNTRDRNPYSLLPRVYRDIRSQGRRSFPSEALYRPAELGLFHNLKVLYRDSAGTFAFHLARSGKP